MRGRRISPEAVIFSAFIFGFASACSNEKSTSAYSNCKLPIANANNAVSLGGFPRHPDRLRSTGTVNATVIMVDFPDAVASLAPSAAYAKISGATATFTEMSYGKMQYSMNAVSQWFRMSKASTAYSIGSGGLQAYIQEAVDLADSTVDFSSTESLVVLANPDATGIGNSGPAMTRYAGYGISTNDGVEILNAVASAYDLNTWGSIWLNHEVTHTLGLVDLYAYGGTNYTELLKYTGGFSYMGFNSFTSNAPGLTAWERWVLGWLDDSQIICANPIDQAIDTLITPIGETGGVKAVVVPIGSTKVIVVESRRASGIDANIKKTGALIYTVDTSKDSGKGAMQVYPTGSDYLFTDSPRAAGESVEIDGIKIEVSASTSSGDQIRISANKIRIDR